MITTLWLTAGAFTLTIDVYLVGVGKVRPSAKTNCITVDSKTWPFSTQISGRNFLPELCGEVHPRTTPLQALWCALRSTEKSTFRGGKKGEKVLRKWEEEGWPAKGAKRKKGRASCKKNKFLGWANFLKHSAALSIYVLTFLKAWLGFHELTATSPNKAAVLPLASDRTWTTCFSHSHVWGAKFYTPPPPLKAPF